MVAVTRQLLPLTSSTKKKRDMLMYEVADQRAEPRLIIRYDGQRLSQAYDALRKGWRCRM